MSAIADTLFVRKLKEAGLSALQIEAVLDAMATTCHECWDADRFCRCWDDS